MDKRIYNNTITIIIIYIPYLCNYKYTRMKFPLYIYILYIVETNCN